MPRVLVVGIPCSGKTTLAAQLSARLGVPHIEVDAYHWGPHWSMRADFYETVEAASEEDGWVADDWGAPVVRDLLWSRADLLVWLDPPRHRAELRVIRRTALRILRRDVLAGGNRDAVVSWLSPHHPVRYVWSQYATYRAEMESRLAEERWSHLRVVHLTSDAAIEDYLARS